MSVIWYSRPLWLHQDAIKKGFSAQKCRGPVEPSLLPIDPADLGRSYDSVIRINSQSGKGGVAYLLEAEYGIVMPRRLQVEFSGEVQRYTDEHGGEMEAATSGTVLANLSRHQRAHWLRRAPPL